MVLALLVLALGARAAQEDIDRPADAARCLAETMASYDGRTYAQMKKAIGSQESLTCRKHGHAYQILITVSLDAENPPERIQIDFDAVDGDDMPTMVPVTRTVFLLPGETP